MFIGASNEAISAGDLNFIKSFDIIIMVVLGGLGSIAIAALWFRLFPALARRDALVEARP